MGDSKAMGKIEIHVVDSQGNVDVETPWATPLGNNLFRLENSPFYAYGVSYEDVVEAVESKNGGFPVFTKVV